MQASSRSVSRSLAAISMLVLLLTAGAGASPTPPHYAITDLGTLGGSDSDGINVNDAGQVVGSANLPDGSTHAFLWTGGKMQDLGPAGGNPSQALSINNRGVIVGWASNSGGSQKPAIWTDGVFQDLSPGGPWGVADVINDMGQVVGHLNGGGTMWTDGVAQSLFPGPVGCINNAGNWAEYTDAAAYLKGGTLLANMAYPTNMNEKGEVVGLLRASPGHLAVLWTGGQIVRLGTRRAALTLTDNASGGQQTIALDGAGILLPSGSPGSGAIPTGADLVLASVDGVSVQSQRLGANKVLVVLPGQHVTLKLLAKFSNGAAADVTGDTNSHIGLGAPMGQFTAKNTWMARPADAGRLVTFYGRYRSLAGGRQLVGTVRLSVRANRRR